MPCRIPPLWGFAMTYENSREEKQAIQKRLKESVVSLNRVEELYAAWAKEKGLPYASRETLDNWMCSKFEGGKNPDWHHEKARTLRDFLKTHPELTKQHNETATLVRLLENHFHVPHRMPHTGRRRRRFAASGALCA